MSHDVLTASRKLKLGLENTRIQRAQVTLEMTLHLGTVDAPFNVKCL